MRRLSLLIFTVFCLSTFASPVLAQDPEPNYDRINEIAKDLNCPTCTGINLADCRTLTCEQWREKIGELVDEGYSNQQVLDYFSTRYGRQVLQEPPRSGFTLMLWVLPVIALLAGGGWLFYTIRGWSNQTAEEDNFADPSIVEPVTSPAANKLPNDYLSQVDKDLGLD